MAGNGVAATATSSSSWSRPRPTITLPPPENQWFDSTSFSPGPMTLVSSLFPDTGCQSFSQLLAMASPVAGSTSSLLFGPFPSIVDAQPNDEEEEDEDKSFYGFKQKRPVGLMVATSPLLMMPPGLSPSEFLASPAVFTSHGQLQSPFGMSHQQALAQVTAEAAMAQSNANQTQAVNQPASSEPAESMPSTFSGTTDVAVYQQIPLSTLDSRSPVIESSEVHGSDSKLQSTSIAVDQPTADGYNWRKYGQKQVKGSVFPRSYYKCTHIGCPVKKKVERSIEGQIIEIIYKGQHNHELPRFKRKVKNGEKSNGKDDAQRKPEDDKSDNHFMDTKAGRLLPEDTRDSCILISNPVQQNIICGTDMKLDTNEESLCTEDEPNPKRSRKAIQPTPPLKTVTESRIVVQTRSEVDLLDDGFKWRKYGQKVVKGNPNPRSYYKCTTPGCSVRKHVERAAADPKAVITTYEGKHTHDIPSGRYSQKQP